MKKLLNIIFAVLAIAGLLFASITSGLQFFIGFVAMYIGVFGLVKTNTNWLEEY